MRLERSELPCPATSLRGPDGRVKRVAETHRCPAPEELLLALELAYLGDSRAATIVVRPRHSQAASQRDKSAVLVSQQAIV